MSDKIMIKVENASKTFKLPHEKNDSIKSAALNFHKQNKSFELQKALENVSFEIKKGEFFGIVGRNGSGKSTLLKMLAGIYLPSEGSISVNGKLTPFIELGVGFNPELTGRENVFLNGALLGFNRKEMGAMYEDIVKFAELERFMDQKLKNYSSGMQVRLAFSIAIRAESDILVLDEVLAVGDANFQQKCFNYFEKIKKDGKTVVLVTHDMAMVRRFCTRALLIEDGIQKSIGSPEEIASQYTLDNMNAENIAGEGADKKLSTHIKALGVVPRSPLVRSNKESFIFDVVYELNAKIEVDLGISILYQGVSIIEHSTKELKLSYKPHVKHRITYNLPLKYFNPGRFDVSVAIFLKKDFKLIGFNSDACSFVVKTDSEPQGGLLIAKGEWLSE